MSESSAALREVSPVFADQGPDFVTLRASDPQRSLEARWRIICDKRREVAERCLGFVPSLLEHTWALIGIAEDAVLYTIGLHYRYGQPELLVSDPALRADPAVTEFLKHVLNELGARVRAGERIGAGDTVRALGVELTFRTYGDPEFDRYPCGYLAEFEQYFEDVCHTRGGTLPILWAQAPAGMKLLSSDAPGAGLGRPLAKKRTAKKKKKKTVKGAGKKTVKVTKARLRTKPPAPARKKPAKRKR